MKYLGEVACDVKDSPYKDYSQLDFIMLYIEMFGHIDGSHHKMWLIDQIARIAKGGTFSIRKAQWEKEDGTIHEEFRFDLSESECYTNWVKSMLGEQDEDGEYEYDYDPGIPP